MGNGELRVDGWSVMRFRNQNGTPGINICDMGLRHWVAVKPSLVSSTGADQKLTILSACSCNIVQ